MPVNGLLCHEAAELLLPHGFDDPRAALGVLAPETEAEQQRMALQRGRGGEAEAALGCDEEIEEEDGAGMMAVDDVQQPHAGFVAARRRGPQQHQTVAMAEPAAIRAPHPAAATGSGTLARPPMGPQANRAPLPMPHPPRALGRSQSLPAYHTSVNYYGGAGTGFGARQPHHPQHQKPPHPRVPAPQPQPEPAALPPPPPPPPFLLRQRSFSCLSRPYRSTTGRFLSENLARVEEAAPREDVAERVVTMHAQERDYYAPPLAYFHRLETDPLLSQWRRGAVRWFSKVVEHQHANREAIATATNFLDRHLGSRLYPAPAPNPDPNPLLPPPLVLEEQDHDQAAFERAAACALALALKMHQGDSTASLAPRLAALTSASCALTARALCALEFEMVGTLGRYLNPPTPGTLIHHLLHFLPSLDDDEDENEADDEGHGHGHGHGHSRCSSNCNSSSSSSSSNTRQLLLALDDHANDLALMALETPALAAFPVSVVAVAAILASFARLRADGANKWLDPILELRWLQALDANDLKVEPDEITECLEQLGRQAKKAAAAASSSSGASSPTRARSAVSAAASQVGVGSPLSGVEGLYLPYYLNPPTERKAASSSSASSTPATPGPNGEGKMARALSPTGVDEIDGMLEGDEAVVVAMAATAAREGTEQGVEGMMVVA